MSGNILARASALSLILILAACGGDENSAPLVGTGGSTNSGGDSSSGDDSSSEQEVVLELGSGSGSNFVSGQIIASATNLSAGGTTRLDFNVVNAADGNAIYNAESTTVNISSLCESAVFDTPLTTSTGIFSTTYEAGCAGQDTITARLTNGATASVTVDVAAPEVGELEFVSVDPDSIALSGSSNSSRPSVSKVTFRLTDKNGNPITTEEDISFSLSTTVGGVSLSQSSTVTDQEGLATTRVNAGTVATVVSVTATYTPDSGSAIQTTSAPISISASIPDQNSFSLSIEENFLPNARNYDGVSVPVTIRAADRNNNRVSDAVVNFLTNGGSVQSECILQDGACSIEWISQDPRPADSVVQILARTVGEESFTDVNSDGKYVSGTDTFNPSDDRGEAFLDANRNEAYDANEVYFDYNSNGSYDAGNGIYNGSACSGSNCTSDLLEISETGRIFMASDNISITFTTPTPLDIPGQACATIAGVFYNNGVLVEGPPPGGTQIDFSTTNGNIVAPSSFSSPTNYRETPVEFCVLLEADSTSSSGILTVEVTPPSPFSGNPFYEQITVQD